MLEVIVKAVLRGDDKVALVNFGVLDTYGEDTTADDGLDFTL